jgi:hypothetical protein
VHFSSVPRLDREVYFPADLLYALNHPNMAGGLCCSVVRPGDTRANTFGTVGLVLDLRIPDSLIAVSRDDGGAVFTDQGSRDFDPKYKKFDRAELEHSISERARGSHNEWGVENYIVRGVFVLPGDIVVCGPNETLENVTLFNLFTLFPGLRVYSFLNKEIVEMHPRSGPVSVDHREIYR